MLMTSYSIVIVSANRPEVLRETLHSISRQSYQAEEIILILNSKADLPNPMMGSSYVIHYSTESLTKKRNLGIILSQKSSDSILFLDDDVELHPDYAAEACSYLESHPEVLALSGQVLADRWMPRAQAREIVSKTIPPPALFRSTGKHWILYGCNMLIRREILMEESFDENLPLYSWGEDYELSIRIARRGLVGRLSSPICLHLKAPAGRLKRGELTWTMIANSYYFLQKGSIHTSLLKGYFRFFYCTARLITQQFLQDILELRSGFPGTRGGIRALSDLVLGRLHPLRLTEIVKS